MIKLALKTEKRIKQKRIQKNNYQVKRKEKNKTDRRKLEKVFVESPPCDFCVLDPMRAPIACSRPT